MANSRIRRRVKTLDTSNQLPLFEEAPPAAPEPRPVPKGTVQFEAPDPRAIVINRVRLEDHLHAMGLKAPLRIRALLETLSFRDFEQDYRPGGRPPYSPRALVGVILYGIVQGISSLRDLERMARADLGCWWVSGGILPDHSVIGRFIQQHAERLSADFFDRLTRQVLKATGSGTAVVAGDGTVIEAMASRFRLVREEALATAVSEAQAAADAHPEQPQAADRVARLKQAQVRLAERQQQRAAKGKDSATTQIHPDEPEAVVQPQKHSKDYRASYKPSLLANEARVILACDVHASSETEPVADLLDRAQALGAVETALFDAGYFSEGVIRAAEARAIELLCPEGQSWGDDWNKQSEHIFPKSRFVYCAESDVYWCPNQQTLTPRDRCRGSATAPAYTVYATAACAACPLKSRCTRSGTGRRIKRYAIDAAKDALRNTLAQEEHRQRYRRRQAMVEPVFSHLRGRQGLRRFRRRGLAGVRVEFALHALAYNLSRAVAWAALWAYWRRFVAPGRTGRLLNASGWNRARHSPSRPILPVARPIPHSV